MAFPKAIEAAEAVNSLLQLSASDQESLLAVAVDYFTSPSSQEEDSDQEDKTEMDLDLVHTFSHAKNSTYIVINLPLMIIVV